MLVFAFIAFFSSNQEGQNILVTISSVKQVGQIGNMHIKHYLNMLEWAVLTTSVLKNAMILKIKDKVYRVY
jgi:hypothetical protein